MTDTHLVNTISMFERGALQDSLIDWPEIMRQELANRNKKWNRHFLGMAKFVSRMSKDPSTKTGAVVVDTNRRVVSTGYNGFARGVTDSDERYADRDLKYKLVVHCEVNAILFAKQDLTGMTLYTWPFMSCSRCAGIVIQSGIKRCIAPVCPPDKLGRWGEDLELAALLFKEAGVVVELI